MTSGRSGKKKLHKDFLNNRVKLVICVILHALYDLAKYEGMQNGSQGSTMTSRENKGLIRQLLEPKYLSL